MPTPVFSLSYPAHLLLISGTLGGLLALKKSGVAAGLGAAVATYTLVVWVLHPVVDAARSDWASLALFGGYLVGMALLATPHRTGSAWRRTVSAHIP